MYDEYSLGIFLNDTYEKIKDKFFTFHNLPNLDKFNRLIDNNNLIKKKLLPYTKGWFFSGLSPDQSKHLNLKLS